LASCFWLQPIKAMAAAIASGVQDNGRIRENSMISSGTMMVKYRE
jgi:hypothetical protein